MLRTKAKSGVCEGGGVLNIKQGLQQMLNIKNKK